MLALAHPTQPHLDAEFIDQIRQEFLTGSAISPEQFRAAIAFASDLEYDPATGEPITPLEEIFGSSKRYRRFAHQLRASEHAALFQQETGSTWQGKFSIPQFHKENGTPRHYRTPDNNGNPIYLPPVSLAQWVAIAQRHGLTQQLPPWLKSIHNRRRLRTCASGLQAQERFGQPEQPGSDFSFWHWIQSHPEIPILLTEGGKKGLCALSHGVVAIALYGIWNGALSKNEHGQPIDPILNPQLVPFCDAKRQFIIAFDQDEKRSTQRLVGKAIARLFHLLTAQGVPTPQVARWDGKQGRCKGLDDLVANRGIGALCEAIAQAIPLNHWRILSRLRQATELEETGDRLVVEMDVRQLSAGDIPNTGLTAIRAAKGRGKTTLVGRILNHDQWLTVSHRVSLARNTADRFGGHYYHDLDRAQGHLLGTDGIVSNGITLCVDSLLAIHPDQVIGKTLFIDEPDQLLRHLLTGQTCGRQGKRPALLQRLQQLLQNARRVVIASSDLEHPDLDYLAQLSGKLQFVFIDPTPSPTFNVTAIQSPDPSPLIARLIDALENGQRCFLASDSRTQVQALEKLLTPILGAEAILAIHAQSSHTPEVQEFNNDPSTFLDNHPEIQIVLASPAVGTGVDIHGDGLFDLVFGIFHGISILDRDASQALQRVREPVPRIVWAKSKGTAYSPLTRATNPVEIKGCLQRLTSRSAQLLRRDFMPTDYDWASDLHLNRWAQMAAERNQCMSDFRAALILRLQHEGHRVESLAVEPNREIQIALSEARKQVKQESAIAIANARPLDETEASQLHRALTLKPEDANALEKFHLQHWYVLPNLTPEDVLNDRTGRTRTALRRLEYFLAPDLALNRDLRHIERQTQWSDAPATPWDLSHDHQAHQAMLALGFEQFLTFALDGNEWNSHTEIVEQIATKARHCAEQVKEIFRLSINDRMSNAQIIGEFLHRLGLKTRSRRQRIPGQTTVAALYSLDPEHTAWVQATLQRRAQQRSDMVLGGRSSPRINDPEKVERGGRSPSSKTENQGEIVQTIPSQRPQNPPTD